MPWISRCSLSSSRFMIDPARGSTSAAIIATGRPIYNTRSPGPRLMPTEDAPRFGEIVHPQNHRPAGRFGQRCAVSVFDIHFVLSEGLGDLRQLPRPAAAFHHQDVALDDEHAVFAQQ